MEGQEEAGFEKLDPGKFRILLLERGWVRASASQEGQRTREIWRKHKARVVLVTVGEDQECWDRFSRAVLFVATIEKMKVSDLLREIWVG